MKSNCDNRSGSISPGPWNIIGDVEVEVEVEVSTSVAVVTAVVTSSRSNVSSFRVIVSGMVEEDFSEGSSDIDSITEESSRNIPKGPETGTGREEDEDEEAVAEGEREGEDGDVGILSAGARLSRL